MSDDDVVMIAYMLCYVYIAQYLHACLPVCSITLGNIFGRVIVCWRKHTLVTEPLIRPSGYVVLLSERFLLMKSYMILFGEFFLILCLMLLVCDI
jgi:hypothetical protein